VAAAPPLPAPHQLLLAPPSTRWPHCCHCRWLLLLLLTASSLEAAVDQSQQLLPLLLLMAASQTAAEAQ
jgi:hypothetical protein